MTWLLALPVIVLVGGATALVARRHDRPPGWAKGEAWRFLLAVNVFMIIASATVLVVAAAATSAAAPAPRNLHRSTQAADGQRCWEPPSRSPLPPLGRRLPSPTPVPRLLPPSASGPNCSAEPW